MSKFQWLKDYRELEYEIAYLEQNLERTKRELKRWIDGDLAKVKITAESHGAKVEDIIERIEWEIAHKMNDLYDIKKLVSAFEGLEHKILVKKYIEGKTLEQVAIDLNYSYNYIKHKHAELMRIMKYIEKVSS